jgi:hypothetical protein
MNYKLENEVDSGNYLMLMMLMTERFQPKPSP